MLGACVGDAAGAVLEFMGRLPTPAEVDRALTMPGSSGKTDSLSHLSTNGRIGPGQVTDDGELTLALWSALYRHPPKLGPPIDEMLGVYARWWASQPPDIGRTCSLAFEAASNMLRDPNGNIDDYLALVQRMNGNSQANGALMRATALAHWAAADKEVPPSLVALMGRADAQLSHPNSVCQDCNALYLYACTLLLRGIEPRLAYKQTGEFAMQTIADQTVLKWFFNDSQDITGLRCQENNGHVRYAFTLAFYFMQNPEIGFEEALRQTLLKGGDTDTNAAIVGGLVGCYSEPPRHLKEPVLTFRADGGKGGHIRPQWLWPWTYFS